MKTWIKQACASVVALGVGAVMVSSPVKAEDAPPIMGYEVDLVSDYVFRGVDQYQRTFAFHKKDDGPMNISPALQPSLTFYGPSGLSLNVWGSLALTDRADDTTKGFTGLSKLDEIDYTLQYDWSNKLGAFTVAIIQYTLVYADPANTTPIQPDFMIKWAMPFAKSVSPYFAYYANAIPGAEYAMLGISGGEAVSWSASFGEKSAGPNDITASVGYTAGDFKVSLSGAYRPTPKLVGYPVVADPSTGKAAAAGKFVDFNGDLKDYPSTILWLTLAYTGSVAAK